LVFFSAVGSGKKSWAGFQKMLFSKTYNKRCLSLVVFFYPRINHSNLQKRSSISAVEKAGVTTLSRWKTNSASRDNRAMVVYYTIYTTILIIVHRYIVYRIETQFWNIKNSYKQPNKEIVMKVKKAVFFILGLAGVVFASLILQASCIFLAGLISRRSGWMARR